MKRPAILLALAVAAVFPTMSRGGGFDRAIATVLPRVVKLYGLGAGVQKGYGTGVVVSEDGLVLTVFSLLIDARVVRAIGADGTRYEARVRYRDKERQLALLQLVPQGTLTNVAHGAIAKDAAGTIGPVPFFDLAVETALNPGDWVVAAGNSFKVAEGAEPVSLAHGVFSVRTPLDARRTVKEFSYHGDVLVIDGITSNPGAPGSALVNIDGAFVGMIGRVVTSNYTHTHFNYAVPRDVLHDFFIEASSAQPGQTSASRPAKRDKATAVDVGIRISRTGYKKVLPFVDRVRRDSPAKRAGLRADDLILSVNGQSVSDADAYEKRIGRISTGSPINLVVRRGRRVLSIRIETETPK